MLSDACSDFLDHFEQATLRLAEAARWYASVDPAAVYGDQPDALLKACVRVQKAPYDDEARVDLLRLAAAVMRSYDTPTTGSSWR